MKKILIFRYMCVLITAYICFNNISYATLSQDVTVGGTTITVTAANQDQLAGWVNNVISTNGDIGALTNLLIGGAQSENIGYYQTANSVGCNNGAGLSWGSAASVVVEPPPPPPCTRPSYITSRDDNWSDCRVTSSWNSSASIDCKQTNNPTPNYSTCSCYGPCPSDVPFSGLSTDTNTFSISLNTPVTQTNDAYANNNDTNTISVKLIGNTNQNRQVTNWGTQGVFGNFQDASAIPSDTIANTGNALNINYSHSISSISPNSTLFQIPVSSTTPFVGTGMISFLAGSTSLSIHNVSYNFKKPFIGILQAWDDVSNQWNGSVSIGTEKLYKLILSPHSTLSWIGLVHYQLENFENKVSVLGSDIALESKSVNTTTLQSSLGTQFNARINTTQMATSLNATPGLQINKPIVSYQLGGDNVRYFLTENDDGNDTSSVKLIGNGFLGVKILGNLQGGGKQVITGQKGNFTDISKGEQRMTIRKNAFEYIKNMTNNTVLNGVKYVEGDLSISGVQDYETLIVKNGNVKITGDISPSSVYNKLGIIVLKDNYKVSTDFTTGGNVYVLPGVKKITAVIYADGGLISADNSGNPMLTDSASRSSTLNNQLILKGSLFTRNTIGGAILAGGNYVLPGGSITSNFDTAMLYDLNYIRRSSKGCDKNGNGLCSDNGEYKEPFVIKYDSSIQLNPPKIFTN